MNFVDRYVAYASKLTEAPRIFHYYMAYMLLSTVVGKKAICNYSDYGAGPNLWMVFIGASSTARKSSSWKIGINLLDEVFLTDPGQGYMIHNNGSYESWIEALDLRKNADGVAQAMMVFDEYKLLHDWITRDYSAPLETLFTSAYDQTAIRRRVGTRKNAVEYFIPSPYINIVAASTMAWFNKSVTQAQILSGFIPRFNIIFSDDTGPLLPRRPMPDHARRDDLIKELQRIRVMAGGEYTYTAEAGAEFDKWYVWMKTKKLPKAADHIAPFYSRRISDVHKYAMLNCIMRGDGSRQMNKEDVEQAIEESIKNVMMFTDAIIDKKMAFTPYEENRLKVYDLIVKHAKNAGPKGAPHSKILKSSKLEKFTFDRIIQTLDEEETIVVVTEKAASNRQMRFYRPNEKGEESDGAANNEGNAGGVASGSVPVNAAP